jgi:hypothetical protein
MIVQELGHRGQGAGVRLEEGSRVRRGFATANTRKNSIEVHGLSIHLLGIIRMESEDVEKLRVEGLMSGV